MKLLLILSLLGIVGSPDSERIDAGRFVFLFASADRELAEQMADSAKAVHQSAFDFIGSAPDGVITVIIASDRANYHNSVPDGARLPDWSVGGAFARRLTIIIDPRHPSPKPPYDNIDIFAHEVAHIYLDSLAHGQDIPRIIDEGIAMHVAREGSFSRFISLSLASIGGNLIPLAKLMKGFPYYDHEAGLAYAQSYHFVNFLLTRYGRYRVFQMIEKIGEGADPGKALFELTGLSFGRLEKDWQDSITRTYAIIPILSSSSLIWFLGSIILVAGYLIKRAENKKILGEWEEEERRYYGDDSFNGHSPLEDLPPFDDDEDDDFYIQ